MLAQLQKYVLKLNNYYYDFFFLKRNICLKFHIILINLHIVKAIFFHDCSSVLFLPII